MNNLTILILLILGVFTCVTLISWSVHRMMVIDSCKKYAYGNFKDFMVQFKARSWERDALYPYAFFSKHKFNDDYIHADIIKFGGVGMILDPISIIQFRIFCSKNSYHAKEQKMHKGYWKSMSNSPSSADFKSK